MTIPLVADKARRAVRSSFAHILPGVRAMFEVRPVALPFMLVGPRHQRVMKSGRRPDIRLCRAAALIALLGVAAALLSSCDESSATGSGATEGKVSANASRAAALGYAPGGSPSSVGTKMFEPGDLTFVPSSGPTTNSPNWTTKGGCPAGHTASAELVAFNLQGDFESRISLPIAGGGPYTSAPGAGVLDFNLDKIHLYATPDVGPDGTIQIAVGCYASADGLGAAVYVQSTFVHFSDNGASYSTSSTS